MLYCIGRNQCGEFGDGHTTNLHTLTPSKWCNNLHITDIYNGDEFCIYRDSNNSFYSAGNNTNGQCMQEIIQEKQNNDKTGFSKGERIQCIDTRYKGNTKYDATISKVEKDKVFVVYAGFAESEGQWISSNEWNKRIFKVAKQSKAAKIHSLKGITIQSIFCTPVCLSRHGFVLSDDNKLYGFGCKYNEHGQIANETTSTKNTLSTIIFKNGINYIIKEIKCAAHYSLLLTMFGKVYGTDCSRDGGNGQNIKNRKGSKGWNHIQTLGNIKKIATGRGHSLCLDSNGNVLSFGNNMWGQLGLCTADKDRHSKPSIIPLFLQLKICVSDICCGAAYSVVLSEAGEVYTFGDNQHGQCGNTPKSEKHVTKPKKVNGLTKISKISCGSSHNAAITDNNVIHLFGYNEYNQCIISNYDPFKDIPVAINDYIKTTYDKKVNKIFLGRSNTKLILSDIDEKEEKYNKGQKQISNELNKTSTWNCRTCTYCNADTNEMCLMCQMDINPNKIKKNEMALHKKLKEAERRRIETEQKLETEERERRKIETEKEAMEQKLTKTEKEKEAMQQKLNQFEREEKEEEKTEIILENLLKSWKLGQYINILISEQGYDDIDDWNDLTLLELQSMGFKPGHSKKFKRKTNEYFMQKRKLHAVNDNIPSSNDDDENREGHDATLYM